jgi:hypothetical protein
MRLLDEALRASCGKQDFMYPSRHGKTQDNMDKLGCFEHLTQVTAAGIDPISEPAIHANKDCKEGGLLIVSKDDHHQSCLL